MYCIHCGAHISDDASHCTKCGTKVPNVQKAQSEYITGNSEDSDFDIHQNEDFRSRILAFGEIKPKEESLDDNPASEAEKILESHKLYKQNKQKNSNFTSLGDEDLFSDLENSEALDNLTVLHDLPPVFRTNSKGTPVNPFGSASDVLPSWSSVGQGNISSGTTGRLPRIDAVNPEVCKPSVADKVQKKYVADNSVREGMSSASKIILALLVVFALVLIALSYQFFGEKEGPSDNQTYVEQEQEQPKKPEEKEVKVDTSSEAIFKSLNESYGKLEGYSDKVDDQVDEFNSWFQYSDINKRKKAAKSCDDLEKEIKKSKDELDADMKKREVIEGSEYYSQQKAIDALYDNLIQRLAVLNDSWKRSLESTNPSSDSSYILEPIAKGDGSKALEEYSKNYSKAKPKKI